MKALMDKLKTMLLPINGTTDTFCIKNPQNTKTVGFYAKHINHNAFDMETLETLLSQSELPDWKVNLIPSSEHFDPKTGQKVKRDEILWFGPNLLDKDESDAILAKFTS